MGDSSPDGTVTNRLRTAFVASLVALSTSAAPAGISAQVEADPVLNGRALLGDTALTRGTVVLHHLTNTTQGEVDSAAVAPDGSFSFRLPNVPDPDRGDVFFASIRREGVSYFGSFVTTASQLDSVYAIQTYDTLLAPEEGVDLQIEIRTVFFEAVENRWRVTDVFQLANSRARTVVTREPGAVWRYPLAAGAAEFAVGEGDVGPDVIGLEDGDLVLRAPMSPGSRMFVVRYTLDDMFTVIPTPGVIDQFEVLIREPAPLMEVEGLHGDRYARLVLAALPQARFFPVVRDPVQQFVSLKADMLIRGPQDPAYPGALSMASNLMQTYVTGLRESLDGLQRDGTGKANGVMTLRFEELHDLSPAQVPAIAGPVLGDDSEAEDLARHLERASDPNAELKNDYVSLDRSSQSYFAPGRQAHLPVRITKSNTPDYMAGWEIQLSHLFRPAHEYYASGRERSPVRAATAGLVKLPLIYIQSIVFGLKEVRQNLGFRRRLMLRRNGHQVALHAVVWLFSTYLRIYVTAAARLLSRRPPEADSHGARGTRAGSTLERGPRV